MVLFNMKTLILDGNNILFRAFYVIKNKTYVNGVDITSVEKFFTMIKSYSQNLNSTKIYLTWDKRINKEGENFRKNILNYKGTRNTNSDVLQQVYSCMEVIHEVGKELGIKTILPYNLEADDVIYYLTKNLDGEKVIISADKDILQVVSEDTSIFNTKLKTLITTDTFEELIGLPLDCFVDYKCILGDTADNINGLEKYGEVKSKKLAISKEFDSLSKDQLEILNRNRILIDLKNGPIYSPDEWDSYDKQLEESENSKFNSEEFLKKCDKWELKNLKKSHIWWKSQLQSQNILEHWFSSL